LVAAQRPPVAAIAACTGPECIVDWLIAKLDPETLAARTLVEVEGSPAVNYATGVTELGGALYVTNRGLNRIGVIPAAALAGVEPLRISAPSR
jgi:DNA-binding beta-propeller fold protein YncE